MDFQQSPAPGANRSQEERSLREDDLTRMERLMNEYERSGDSIDSPNASTAHSVQMLALMTTLEQKDLVDRGDSRPSGMARFGLDDQLYKRVSRVVAELQEFLYKASLLVPGRTSYFHVDPEDLFLPVLQETNDVARLLMAWELLRSRLELGHRFFLKYGKECRMPNSIEAFSPASTTQQLQDEMSQLVSSDEKMRHVLAYYPHHYEGQFHERGPDERLHIMKDEWEDIIARLQSNAIGNSYTGYYSGAQGEIGAEEVRSPQSTVKEGKRPESATTPVQKEAEYYDPSSQIYSQPYPLRHRSPLRSPTEFGENTAREPLLAPKTPFRPSKSFLSHWSDVGGSSAHQVPRAAAIPNVLQNIAAGPMGGVGDQYRATFGAGFQASNFSGRQIPQARPSNPFDIHSFPASSDPRSNEKAYGNPQSSSTPKAASPVRYAETTTEEGHRATAFPASGSKQGAMAIDLLPQEEEEEDLARRARRVRRTLRRLQAAEEAAEEAEVTGEMEEVSEGLAPELDLEAHQDLAVPRDRLEIQDPQGHLEVMEGQPWTLIDRFHHMGRLHLRSNRN
ncbi:hypothetical protein B0H14DRAFT_3902369 [Mycena olivaceomarginata]|nr:hypothetical protein B0H14DRAFT_3902369 [Mycena olivaceomarginata]